MWSQRELRLNGTILFGGPKKLVTLKEGLLHGNKAQGMSLRFFPNFLKNARIGKYGAK
jgi:hypothetical protein